ncbi:MAG: plasmid pRiA4b ORF-3 family protein [Elusimicrobia bacterium]|nr:plasmid pRiA4b ORF-3 family protein [Elusimicrobiota bacterium]
MVRLDADYEYDFGDGWRHYLHVEKSFLPEVDQRNALCVAGARACPPEDVGGVSGYGEFLEAINNSEHPEHEERLTWADGAFDPETFDLNQINKNLSKLKEFKHYLLF